MCCQKVNPRKAADHARVLATLRRWTEDSDSSGDRQGVTIDEHKLARILGMLGSDHEGEVFNAARLAQKMLNDAGMTWADAAKRIASGGVYYRAPPEPEVPKAKRESKRHYDRGAEKPNPRHKVWRGVRAGELARYMREHPRWNTFGDFERGFVISILGQPIDTHGLTMKQWDVLWRMGVKYGAVGDVEDEVA